MTFPLLRAFGGGIPKDVLAIVPEIVARRYGVVPFARTDAGVKVAMAKPDDAAMRHWVAKRAGVPVLPHAVPAGALSGALRRYDTAAREAFTADAAERFDVLLAYAQANDAADIHLVPARDHVAVRFRMDGLLLDAAEVSRDASRVLLAAADAHAARRGVAHPIGIARSTTKHGERAILRLLAAPARWHTLHTLGLTAVQRADVRRMLDAPHGVVIVAGQPGAGRTTTLYAMLRVLRHALARVATVEHPIAHAIGGVQQVEAPARYTDALRMVVRAAPAALLVGDLRDAEAARIAFDAAMAGSFVLGGMDADSVEDALTRLRACGIPEQFIATALRGIIAQRLVRNACAACCAPYRMQSEEQRAIASHPGIRDTLQRSGTGDLARARLFRGRGCAQCHHTGYGGRTGMFSVVSGNGDA